MLSTTEPYKSAFVPLSLCGNVNYSCWFNAQKAFSHCVVMPGTVHTCKPRRFQGACIYLCSWVMLELKDVQPRKFLFFIVFFSFWCSKVTEEILCFHVFDVNFKQLEVFSLSTYYIHWSQIWKFLIYFMKVFASWNIQSL